MKNLTSQADDMNEADAELIADVIVDVVTLEDSLNEVRSSASQIERLRNTLHVKAVN